MLGVAHCCLLVFGFFPLREVEPLDVERSPCSTVGAVPERAHGALPD